MHGHTGRRLKAAIKSYLGWGASEENATGNPKTDEERKRLKALQRAGDIKLGTGKLPENFWDLPRPKDPTDSVRRTLIQERREGV